MKDPGDLIDYLEPRISSTIVLPARSVRPELPYVSMVMISSNQGDVYQRAKTKGAINDGNKSFTEEIQTPRYTAFSMTAISDPDNGSEAEALAQLLFDEMKTQAIRDFINGRGESLRILSQPAIRYVLEDDWNETRIGFDILYGDVHTTEEEKEFIDALTIKDKTGKVPEIILPE